MNNNSKSEVKNLRKRSYQDFADEIVGLEARVMLHDGRPLIGRIVEARRYWMKLAVGSSVYYINKAFIVYIQPVEGRKP